MLVIRKEQMDVLQSYQRQQFEQRVQAYLRQALPGQCAGMDEVTLQELIHDGIARALDHDITTEREVVGYLELTLLLGREFDTDAAYPWARPILSDRSSSAANRIRRLRAMARRQGQELGGRRQATS